MGTARVPHGERGIDRQCVTATGFFEREQSAANGGYDFGFAANDPARLSAAGRSASVSGLPSGPMT